jgi:hypothetical protein
MKDDILVFRNKQDAEKYFGSTPIKDGLVVIYAGENGQWDVDFANRLAIGAVSADDFSGASEVARRYKAVNSAVNYNPFPMMALDIGRAVKRIRRKLAKNGERTMTIDMNATVFKKSLNEADAAIHSLSSQILKAVKLLKKKTRKAAVVEKGQA